ncbi:hypothetical protein [Simkania sp.]|uniref:hypothetical protein n=1 Tax=Simkania sp. TaxID=34094 RepID=UPI003B521710
MYPEEEAPEEQEKEILRGEIQEFLGEFEASEETEDDMKTILPIWRDEIINHARGVGGKTLSSIKILINVCEDYANNRGMLERVRKEAEETRIHLGL